VEIERFADVSVLTAYNMRYEVINILLPYFKSCYISVSYLKQNYIILYVRKWTGWCEKYVYGNLRLVISEDWRILENELYILWR